MVTTETELKQDVREMTGYTSVKIMSNDGLDVAYRRAKSHIRIEQGFDPEESLLNPEFPRRKEALFWFTCLFAKVQTGELDAQDLQVGAVNTETLLAKDDDSVTQWYRSARNAIKRLKPNKTMRTAVPDRPGRNYSPGTYSDQTGGASDADDFDI